VPELRGLPHRLEDLGLFEGHRVIDNGVSTTPDSTLSAVLSMRPGFTLLAGGKAKRLPLDELVSGCKGRVRRVILFGSAAESFAPAFRAAGLATWQAPTVREAVQLAFEKMLAGEELLFSPACASFDAYLNFRERALDFRGALPPGSAP
jgi:UDP-N-acetylmuramoylalanine--D-glutamate ligase